MVLSCGLKPIGSMIRMACVLSGDLARSVETCVCGWSGVLKATRSNCDLGIGFCGNDGGGGVGGWVGVRSTGRLHSARVEASGWVLSHVDSVELDIRLSV